MLERELTSSGIAKKIRTKAVKLLMEYFFDASYAALSVVTNSNQATIDDAYVKSDKSRGAFRAFYNSFDDETKWVLINAMSLVFGAAQDCFYTLDFDDEGFQRWHDNLGRVE